jgi:hypothetical protein
VICVILRPSRATGDRNVCVFARIERAARLKAQAGSKNLLPAMFLMESVGLEDGDER